MDGDVRHWCGDLDCAECEEVFSQPLDDHTPYFIHSVTLDEIAWQREEGWHTFHPETFCHRCGHRNPTWHAPNDVWEQGIAHYVDGPGAILCPSCFAILYDMATCNPNVVWEFRPSDLGDEE